MLNPLKCVTTTQFYLLEWSDYNFKTSKVGTVTLYIIQQVVRCCCYKLLYPLSLHLPHYAPIKHTLTATTSLCLFNLLEQLAELRETFHLLNYRFIIKEYNSGTARRKQCIGQSMGKAQGASMLSPGTRLSRNDVSQPRSLETLSFFFFFLSLHYIGLID